MKYLYLFLSLAVVSSTNIMVPVTFDEHGHAFVEVDIDGCVNRCHSLIVSPGCSFGVNDRWTPYSHLRILIPHTHVSIIPTRLSIGVVPGMWGELPMGYGSDLLREYGSLALIKNATNPTYLVVGATDDFFMSTCFEGSRWQISRPIILSRISGFFQLGTDTVLTDSVVNVERFEFGSTLRLSRSLAAQVHDKLIASGAIGDGPSFFTNCTVLPDDLALTLAFPTTMHGSPDALARIVLYSNDYIEHDPVANTCSFLLSESLFMQDPTQIIFNPLLVSGTNVRITRVGDSENTQILEFCDTIYDV
jgi:hypothetical protein